MGTSSQFKGVVKTNLIKALLENRGCRWISNSNSKQYCKSSLNSCLENANKISKKSNALLCRRNSGPAVPHVGGGIFYTDELIQICTLFVVDFDQKHHISTQFSSFPNQICL